MNTDMRIPSKGEIVRMSVEMVRQAREFNAQQVSLTFFNVKELEGWNFRLTVAAPGVFEQPEFDSDED